MTNDTIVLESAGELHDSEWKRNGYKRFEDAMVKAEHENRRVVVRFNSSMGRFGASFADMTFYSSDYKALVKRLGEHLQSLQALTFERYLHVEYEQRNESRRHRHGGKEWRGDGKGAVTGIYLEFDVYDVSAEYDTAVHGRGRAGTSKARVWRLMTRSGDEWELSGSEEMRHVYSHHDPFKELIPYTEDRYQTLVGLKESLGKVAVVLNSMFGDKALGGKGIAVLDGMSGQRLLPAPGPASEPNKKTISKKGRAK